MIVSASRRCDIPSACAPWLRARLEEGVCEVANPYNPRAVRRVSLLPGDVDALILWSKNPRPLLGDMRALNRHRWALQFTLNDAPSRAEPGVPPLSERIETFRAFSRLSSPERITWRYDPVCFSKDMDGEYHVRRFAEIAGALEGYTRACVISFLDVYPQIAARIARAGLFPPDEADAHRLARAFSEICRQNGMRVSACAERESFASDGVPAGPCVDAARLSEAFSADIRAPRDKNQRGACLCAQSVDIGRYGICPNGCAYCYANRRLSPAPANPPESLSL